MGALATATRDTAAELELRAGSIRHLAVRALSDEMGLEVQDDCRRMFAAEHESALEALAVDVLPALTPELLADVCQFLATRLRRASRPDIERAQRVELREVDRWAPPKPSSLPTAWNDGGTAGAVAAGGS